MRLLNNPYTNRSIGKWAFIVPILMCLHSSFLLITGFIGDWKAVICYLQIVYVFSWCGVYVGLRHFFNEETDKDDWFFAIVGIFLLIANGVSIFLGSYFSTISLYAQLSSAFLAATCLLKDYQTKYLLKDHPERSS